MLETWPIHTTEVIRLFALRSFASLVGSFVCSLSRGASLIGWFVRSLRWLVYSSHSFGRSNSIPGFL